MLEWRPEPGRHQQGSHLDWFYARLLRPLIAGLAAGQGTADRLAQVLLILSAGSQIGVFHQGGYRLLWQGQGRNKGDGVDELIRLSHASDLVPHLDPGQMMYLGDSFAAGGIDRAVAGKVGIVVNVGPHAPDLPETFVNLGGGFIRTVQVVTMAAGALRASGHASPAAAGRKAGGATVWTFEHQDLPAHGRVRVRIGASGYVHAGLTQADGRWEPVYEAPLIPAPEGMFEAVPPQISTPSRSSGPKPRELPAIQDTGNARTKAAGSSGGPAPPDNRDMSPAAPPERKATQRRQ